MAALNTVTTPLAPVAAKAPSQTALPLSSESAGTRFDEALKSAREDRAGTDENGSAQASDASQSAGATASGSSATEAALRARLNARGRTAGRAPGDLSDPAQAGSAAVQGGAPGASAVTDDKLARLQIDRAAQLAQQAQQAQHAQHTSPVHARTELRQPATAQTLDAAESGREPSARARSRLAADDAATDAAAAQDAALGGAALATSQAPADMSDAVRARAALGADTANGAGNGPALPANGSTRTGPVDTHATTDSAASLAAKAEASPSLAGSASATAAETQAWRQSGPHRPMAPGAPGTSASAFAQALERAAGGAGMASDEARAMKAAMIESLGAAAGAPAGLAGPGNMNALAEALGASSRAAEPGTSYASTPSSAGDVLMAALEPALDSPAFPAALGARVAWMARDGIERAQLDVHPADLGPVSVQLAMDGNQVRVELSSDQALTRQVLEQSLPSLASALRDAGLTLTGGGVFQQPGGQQPRDGSAQPAFNTERGNSESTPAPAGLTGLQPLRGARAQGLVDLFA